MVWQKERNQWNNENPNSVINNLSFRAIDNEKYKISTYGLNYGIAVSPKQNYVLTSNEPLWDQLERNKRLKKNFTSIQRAKKCYLCNKFQFTRYGQ